MWVCCYCYSPWFAHKHIYTRAIELKRRITYSSPIDIISKENCSSAWMGKWKNWLNNFSPLSHWLTLPPNNNNNNNIYVLVWFAVHFFHFPKVSYVTVLDSSDVCVCVCDFPLSTTRSTTMSRHVSKLCSCSFDVLLCPLHSAAVGVCNTQRASPHSRVIWIGIYFIWRFLHRMQSAGFFVSFLLSLQVLNMYFLVF